MPDASRGGYALAPSSTSATAEVVPSHECAGCGDIFAELPLVDTEDWLTPQRRYCTANCLDDASERHWNGAV